MCGEIGDGAKATPLKIGVIVENFLLAHARGNPTEHIPHVDAKLADMLLAGTLSQFACDPTAYEQRIATKHQGHSGQITRYSEIGWMLADLLFLIWSRIRLPDPPPG